MAFEVTKKLVEARIEIVLILALVAAMLWFVPELTLHKELVESVDFQFVGMTLFTIPIMISRVISFVIWGVLLAMMIRVNEDMRLIPLRSMLPLVFGMTGVACVGELHVFDERMIAFVLIVHAMKKLCEMYNMQYQVLEGFKMVLFILIASLFRVECLWVLFLFIIGLGVYRVASMKFVLSAILSVVVFGWLLWGIFWLCDSVDLLLGYFARAVDFKMDVLSWNAINYAKLFFGVSLMILTRLQTDMSSYKFNMQIRLNNIMMGVAFWFALIIMLVFGMGILPFVIFMAIESLCLYFSSERSNISNVIFIIMSIILIVSRMI